MMFVYCFQSGKTNCYILKVKQCTILIDAGVSTDKNFIEKLSNYVDPNTIDYLILTHGHPDHVGNAWLLQTQYGVKILMHQLDVPFVINREEEQGEKIHGKGFLKRIFHIEKRSKRFHPFFPDFVMEGQYTELSKPEIRMVHLPGHTAGSIGIICEKEVFVGDVFSEKEAQENNDTYQKNLEWLKKIHGIENYYGGHGRNILFQTNHTQKKEGIKKFAC